MKLDLTLAATALLASGVNALNLKAEHAGGVINRVHGGKFLSDDGVINDGTPSGQDVSIGNETGYVTYPPRHQAKAAVLYLTDIFGNSF